LADVLENHRVVSLPQATGRVGGVPCVIANAAW
jgi:hypothetical protein